MSYILYQFLGWLFFIAVFPFAYLFFGIFGKRRQEFRQRRGRLDGLSLDPSKAERIWLHAASVGEVGVAVALVSEIRKQLPEAAILVSVMTRAGFLMATSRMPTEVACIFAPLDLGCFVDRALAKVKPSVYVCLETELWPNMIRQAYRHGAKLFLLNGRISERSFVGYRWIKGLIDEVLSCFVQISVIQGSDAKRFRALGADPAQIRILGNAKFDQASLQTQADCSERYRRLLGIRPGQPVFIAGSTHSGEEEMLIAVVAALKQRLTDLVWVLAPRHLQRLAEVEDLLSRHKLPFDRLSRLKETGRSSGIVLVDNIGELAAIYSVASYVFCGGSLVNRGGHNLLEPAAWGHPVFYGPYTADFADARALLESERAGFCVKNADELSRLLLYFIKRPEEYAVAERNAAKVAGRQQDSAGKQVALIREVLHGVPVPEETIN